MKASNKLGLYIHIPFCEKKCNYCDFLSGPPKSDTVIKEYAQVLCEEIKLRAKEYGKHYKVDTLYIGGGTPSLLDVESITKITETIKASFIIEPDYEWTIECNPNSVTFEKLKTYRDLGINRISIGFQAKQDYLLHTLGRIHTLKQFETAYALAKEAGFINVNVDVMYGLPGQSIDDFKETLEYVIGLSPSHISAYSLILEEGTPFYERYALLKDPIVDDDTLLSMEECLFSITDKAGYHRYEISNFSKDGLESRHNLRYWRLEDYLGIGLGASSCIFGNPGKRMQQTTDLKKYLGGDFTLNSEENDLTSFAEEYCFLGLRMLKEGIDFERFYELFSKNVFEIFDASMINKRINEGLLEYMNTSDKPKLILTKKGAQLSNMVMADFLLERK